MTTDDEVRRTGRRLRDLVEPVAASVYFAPEALEAYRDLGLDYLPGYFCSRSACMGQLAGPVVAAVFGVFNPAIVTPAVRDGWSKTDAPTLLDARRRGATAALERILGGAPDGTERATDLLRRAGAAVGVEGHPLAAGLASLDVPADPLGALWRAADVVREHRGDSHTAAWVGAGVGAVEITLLTELWWRLPLKSYAPTRGWSDEELDAGVAALEQRGLVEDGAFTPTGERLRAGIEEATDRLERPVVEALGDDADELLALLEPMAKAVVASGGYPRDPSSLTRP